jgi:hypothetical protein
MVEKNPKNVYDLKVALSTKSAHKLTEYAGKDVK